MTITYSKLLKGYIAEIKRTVAGEAVRSFIAIKPTRLEVLEVALTRLSFKRQ